MIKGSIVDLVTPLLADGLPDVEALGAHAPTLPQSSDYLRLRGALRSAKVLG